MDRVRVPLPSPAAPLCRFFVKIKMNDVPETTHHWPDTGIPLP